MPPPLLRRLISFTSLYVAFLATITLGPFALVLTWGFDRLTGGHRWRALAMGLLYTLAETVGLTAGALLTWSGPRPHRWVQRRWATALVSGAQSLFRLRLIVEGEVPSGPLIVLVRHCSLAETPLPLRIFDRLHPRYVLKEELLWDPCLDLFGHRLPNAFIRRGAGASEVRKIEVLADGLTDDEMVVIFPEGTRFSEAKRQRRIDELTGLERERAQALRHTLLPRPDGTLALLRSAVDVVVLGHTGFETLQSAAGLVDGSLVGREIRVRLWHISAEDVEPTEAWLYERWRILDEWLEECSGTVPHELVP